jgi:lipopolysaccharide/colanic/teichoic acid biosynthesis glycosyltransferase
MPTDATMTTKAPPPLGLLARALKRTFDILGSAFALVLFAPLLLVAALAIKLGSSGPVLFRQERVGRNFRRFRILKFRTMVQDAERQGTQITAGDDPRITRVGRLLRRTKLDELPQLLNVLAGQMSLVGPRPEVPRYVEMFRDEFAAILTVRPGITDAASIKFRDEAELLGHSPDPEREYVERILPEKLALAREYLERWSLTSDLRLLWQTARRVIGR